MEALLKIFKKTINIANDDDTIVLNGTYKSTGHQIVVNKSITITSENGYSTLDANKKYRALYILSDSAEIGRASCRERV